MAAEVMLTVRNYMDLRIPSSGKLLEFVQLDVVMIKDMAC